MLNNPTNNALLKEKVYKLDEKKRDAERKLSMIRSSWFKKGLKNAEEEYRKRVANLNAAKQNLRSKNWFVNDGDSSTSFGVAEPKLFVKSPWNLEREKEGSLRNKQTQENVVRRKQAEEVEYCRGVIAKANASSGGTRRIRQRKFKKQTGTRRGKKL